MVKKREKQNKNEVNIWNLPTFLNISRVLLTFVVVYMIVTNSPIVLIVIIFSIAAITDFFDGILARKYHLVNEFGAKADMFADRFLWVGTTLAIAFVYGIEGKLQPIHGIQLFAIMIREIISAPFAAVAFFDGNAFPPARYIAKVTTFLQGFALPTLLLSIFYPNWIYVSLPLSLAILITGFISAKKYILDIQK